MDRIRRADPPPLVELDPPLRELVLRCLRKAPAERFADAGPLRAALRGLGEEIAGPEELGAWVKRGVVGR